VIISKTDEVTITPVGPTVVTLSNGQTLELDGPMTITGIREQESVIVGLETQIDVLEAWLENQPAAHPLRDNQERLLLQAKCQLAQELL